MPRALALCATMAGAVLIGFAANAARAPATSAPDNPRAALAEAQAAFEEAERRSAELASEAQQAEDEADRAARAAVSVAAQIQTAEAGINLAEARIDVIDAQNLALARELAVEQQPLVELTGAMQLFARRPLALAVARPGSVKELVYLRAVMDGTRPEFERRTAGLRDRIAERRALRASMEAALETLRDQEESLTERRAELAEMETRQRLLARQRGDVARTESERALALGEQARDLDSLVDEFDRAGVLREQLAALPGPRLRPADPQTATAVDPPTARSTGPTGPAGAPAAYVLPVNGRIVTGFGAPLDAGVSRGLTIAPRPGAQAVAPAAGRVAFAGPYRGYGSIVIIEHAGGWTSLVTGLSRVSASVGDDVIAGSPLGVAASDAPQITLELRRAGEPVNPIDHLR